MGMRIVALHHTKMAKEVSMRWTVVSSTVEIAIERSPYEAFRVEVLR
jgi:hypothetical protein